MGYIIGLARNARLHAAVEVAEAALADAYQACGIKQRLIGEFSYAAKSWSRERRVITRLEYGSQGTNPRFVVTNLEGEPDALYDGQYCQRGEEENRIKEAKLDLFGTRASCSRFIAKQFRLLLAALAYTLMQRLRALALKGTELERAAPPPSVCGCSRSARPSCATPGACGCCWPAITRCASCFATAAGSCPSGRARPGP